MVLLRNAPTYGRNKLRPKVPENPNPHPNLRKRRSHSFSESFPDSTIETVTILSPELWGPDISSKQSRLDLYVKLQDGTLIDLEMQSSRDAQFIKRSVYYTFQMIGSDLRKGDKYNRLQNFLA